MWATNVCQDNCVARDTIVTTSMTLDEENKVEIVTGRAPSSFSSLYPTDLRAKDPISSSSISTSDYMGIGGGVILDVGSARSTVMSACAHPPISPRCIQVCCHLIPIQQHIHHSFVH
jgi:hypothetical protein